ncbi:hypothetical protein [Actinomadura xylanilytica]|uniref:hypothetical protein n=1 Tax=Actinomadura xylanilytica TaxID=887459 RepID=UPI00255AC4AD|nr:hypothetical protein [Actinomadura xylanilytica]MDL4776710.1 hypothetical protein [Actinomadura xylanilytica]
MAAQSLLDGAALLGACVVAAGALLRPFAGVPSRTVSRAVTVAAAVTVTCTLMAVHRPLIAIPLAVPALLAALTLDRARWAFAFGLATAATLIATVTVTAITRSGPVEPGVPLLAAATGDRGPVLVVPHRPGWNLVHVGAAAEVGTDRARLRAAVPVPGTNGRWAMVRLPDGPGRLWIRQGGRVSSQPVDTGRTTASGITWNDGPECASAALGGLAAGRAEPLRACPADGLDARDAAALRATVRFIAARRARSITLIGDSSPRSAAAARAVRAASGAAGITVADRPRPEQPIVVVSGWSTAHTRLRDVAKGRLPGAGAYLAPWLLAAPLLTIPAGQLLPLRFSPRDELPLRYATALAERFPGEPPTSAGYDGWLAARGSAPADETRLYAASVVRFPTPGGGGHAHGDWGWLPEGTVTAVSGPLK